MTVYPIYKPQAKETSDPFGSKILHVAAETVADELFFARLRDVLRKHPPEEIEKALSILDGPVKA